MTVTDPAGKPLAGALVMALPTSGSYRPDGSLQVDRVRSALTARDGHARLDSLPRGPWTVAVHARGHATSVRRRVAVGPLAVRLDEGGAITGVVREGESGRPVKGSRVSVPAAVESPPGGWEEEALRNAVSTDAQGRFRLEGIGRSPLRLTARAPGFAAAERADVRAGQAVELFLFPGAGLAGTVRDEGGRPVEGAVVQAESDGSGPNPPVERTDSRGEFVMAGVRPGGYAVVAREGARAPGIAFVIVEPGATPTVALTLASGAYVTGRIVDAQGRPIQGQARLETFEGRRVPGFLAERTMVAAKADGTFALGPLPVGALGIGLSASSRLARRVDTQALASGRTVDLGDLTLEAGLSIRGGVRDTSGNPLAGATVHTTVHDAEDSEPDVSADASGAFVAGGLGPGRYDVRAEAAGFAWAQVTAEAGGPSVVLVLEPAGEIAGRVVDADGAAVDGARVDVERAGVTMETQRFAATRSDEGDGGFTLRDLAPGAYALTARASGRGEASIGGVRVHPGRTTAVGAIVLAPGGVVRGSVVDGEGHGVPGAAVTVERDTSRRRGVTEVQTDSSGAFEARGIPAGVMRVVARHPAYADATPVTTTVDPEKEATPLRIVLARGGVLEGRVSYRDGRPFTAGGVTVSTPDGRGRMQAPSTVGADGSFRLERVLPGRARVVVMAHTPSSPLMLGGGEDLLTGVASREVEVRDEDTTRCDVALRDVVIAGKVTRGGQPAAGVAVSVWSHGEIAVMTGFGAPRALPEPGPPVMNATTREDGSYELLVFTPGPSSVQLQSAGQTYPDRMVDVPDVERHELDLEIASASLSGVVVDREDGTPVAGASVSLRRADGSDWSGGMECGPDGHFSLGVEPGDYRLEARAADHQPADLPVSVSAAGLPDLRVEMERGLSIAGRVLDTAGRLQPGLAVTAMSADAGWGGRATTVADGTFRMGGLNAKPYTLVAGSDTLGFAVRSGVTAGGDPVTLRLRPGGRIVVRVVDAAGQPLKGVFARVESIDGTPARPISRSLPTDDSGTAVVPCPEGLAIVVVRGPDGQTGQASVAVRADQSSPLTVVLSDGGARGQR